MRRTALNISDRPLYCLCAFGGGFVAGGADHSLYFLQFDSSTQDWRQTHCLYQARFGHLDWVTCCTEIAGMVVSGGQDSLLALWEKDSRPGRGNFIGRDMIKLPGPLSAVKTHDSFLYASCYNGSIYRYQTARRGQTPALEAVSVFCLPASRVPAPVLDFAFANHELVASDKGGTIHLFSLSSADFQDSIQAHSGPVDCLAVDAASDLIYTAGRVDGSFRAFQPTLPKSKGRRRVNIQVVAPQTGGSSCMVFLPPRCNVAGRTLVLAGGNQGSLHLYRDSQMSSIQPTSQSTAVHPAGLIAYCLLPLSPASVVVGWGDGALTFYNLDLPAQTRMTTPCKNALRCLSRWNDKVVGVGDDGVFLTLDIPREYL
ncbi:hypothetical protein HDU91_003895 [Kappamyces sp. JEL0680]|nr:hypothetical protein HDU91_003895 [Kappamyces sp. JEL0680]